MRYHVLLPTVLAALLSLSCDSATVAPTVGTILHVEGAVSDGWSGPAVADAHVLVGFWTPGGLGAWASGSTDADGAYSVSVEVPVACVPGDSLAAVFQVEAEDFSSYSLGSLEGSLRLACDTTAQRLDAVLHRDVYRRPQSVAGDRLGVWLAASRTHACAVMDEGTWCWGRAGAHLGNVVFGAGNASTPVRVLGGHAFTRVATGPYHSCALDSEGRAWCWGSGEEGALGPGTAESSVAPVQVSAELRFVDVVAGRWHSCGLTGEGEVWCWGLSRSTGAGIVASASDVQAEPVLAVLQAPAVSISSEFSHTCAATSDGDAWCWGYSYAGELGAAETHGDHFVPLKVAGGHTWAVVEAGETFSCALDTDGAAWCWGRDASWGRLGAGEAVGDVGEPVPVAGGHAFVAIHAGGTHACALTADGVAWCWGANDHGQLGVAPDAFDSEAPMPVRVDTDLRFSSLRAGNGFTCGITSEARVFCWGLADCLGAGSAISG